MKSIVFWNGNKSPARQEYELALLKACLKATSEEHGQTSLYVDDTDYPIASDESAIFAKGTDVLVTVAGNLKFDGIDKIACHQPLSKGLLGYRLLIVKDDSLATFADIQSPKQLQEMNIGIPSTWVDADLFRYNQYQVTERGSLEGLFSLLKQGVFDYVALGVNEIESIFNLVAVPLGGLSIEPSLMLYYPFPLVFYVNPNNIELADRLKKGLQILTSTGEFDKIFNASYGGVVERLSLSKRTLFSLTNPSLPQELASYRSSLLG